MTTDSRKERYLKAQRLYQSRQYDAALSLLDGLAREMPDNADVLYARALCLASSGERDEALRVCDKLIGAHGHTKAQRLKAEILEKMPSPNLVEVPTTVNAAAGKRVSARRLVPVAVLIVLVAAGGALYFYASAPGTGDTAGPALSAETPAVISVVGGAPVTLANQTDARVAVWVDQVGATDAPVLTLTPRGAQEVALQEGERALRFRADFDDASRFFTAAHTLPVDGPARLVLHREENAQGVTELKFRVE